MNRRHPTLRQGARAIVSGLRTIAATTWSTLGSFVGMGGYSSTDPKNQISRDFRPARFSARDLATTDLPSLRAQCRHLDRVHAPARAIAEGLAANLVGSGIALQPQTSNAATDAALLAVWNRWIEHCGINGESLWQLESNAARELAPSGEFLWRLVSLPADEVTPGDIPLRILPLESEWMSAIPAAGQAPGSTFTAGIECDRFGRPIAYHISDPNAPYTVERVPAASIIHGFERRRAIQVRGEPWLAPVVVTMLQERRLIDAELRAAENTAGLAAAITSEASAGPSLYGDSADNDSADREIDIRVGSVAQLRPGEKIEALSHTRPAQQISPFRQMLRGDIAGAVRLGQRWLDRDVSRANYSSMRSDMLDNDRLHVATREWLGHATAGAVYRVALPMLAIVAGLRVVPAPLYRLLPDGQPYVDPQKDIQAASMAIAAGMSTYEAEIAKRGGDYRQVWAQIALEQAEAKKLGLVLDLSGTNAPAPGSSFATESVDPSATNATNADPPKPGV